MSKKIVKSMIMLLIGVVIMTVQTGCASTQRRELEEMFADFFALHPTENLMELLSLPGSGENPGIVTISTRISAPSEGGRHNEGMTLNFNEVTGEVTGEYFVWPPNSVGFFGDRELQQHIPVYFNEEGIHLVDDVEDEELRERILNFRFVKQLITLDEDYIQSLSVANQGINRNNGSFNISYEIPSDDRNLRIIREQFNIMEEFDRKRFLFFGSGFGEFSHPIPGRTFDIMFGEGDTSTLISTRISFAPIREGGNE